MMDFLLLYYFRKLKGVAIEISLELLENITTNMILEIFGIKNLSEIEKYLAKATLGTWRYLLFFNSTIFIEFMHG